MDKLLSRLQRKSDHDKNMIAFGFAGFITTLVIIFWASNFGNSIDTGVRTTSLSDINPIGFFKENISNMVSSISTTIVMPTDSGIATSTVLTASVIDSISTTSASSTGLTATSTASSTKAIASSSKSTLPTTKSKK